MNTSYRSRTPFEALVSAATLGLALACAGCDDSDGGSGGGASSSNAEGGASNNGSGGGSSNNGSGGDPSSGTDSGSRSSTNSTGSGGATCEEACGYSFSECPGEFQGTEESCIAGCEDGGMPAACIDCLAESCIAGCFELCAGIAPAGSSSSGDPSTTSSQSSSVSSTGSGMDECNGGCPDDIGEEGCFQPSDCEGDECFWPNGTFSGYCSKSCEDAADCPSGWSCAPNDQSGNLACEKP